MVLVKEKELKKAGITITEKEFTEKTAKYSLIAAIISIAFVFAFTEISVALISGFLVFICSVILAIKTPEILKKRKAKKIEKHLPFALMAMAVEMNINLSFEKIIKNISNGNYGELSSEIKKTEKEIEAGGTIQKALFNLSERIESKMLKRSVSQIISIYEHGSKEKGEPLKQLAKELLVRQKTEAKEFTSKMIMYSVIFIVLSAIIPAMFQAFIIIGSTFMEIEFSPAQIQLITTIVFPALNSGILLAIKSNTPEFLKG
jgi:pilus assembly protein TadC